MSKWTIGSKGLKTRWAEQVTPDTVWKEYPRPQLERKEWINLNGLWDYQITSLEDVSPLYSFRKEGSILVPFAIESALSGVQRPLHSSEKLWYKTSFHLEQLSDLLILHFGAVDWHTEVWVNGHKIGEHKGGYCPFSFELEDVAVVGNNELIVAVTDPTDEGLQERGKQSLKPQGLFYTAVSGIWQTVWLEQLYTGSIKNIALQADIDKAEIRLDISGYNIWSSEHLLSIKIYAEQQLIVQKEICENGNRVRLCLPISPLQLWSPDSPFLYDVVIEVYEKNKIIDCVKSYFAMRQITIKHDSNQHPLLVLNHQPLFQLGVLDQGYWPDGLYTAPCDEALIFDIQAMKELGFNMLRKHIKVEPARWYYHCDRLGMLVWQDMINGGKPWNMFQEAVLPNIFPNWFRKDDTQASYNRSGRTQSINREQFYAELKEMVDALSHFPSIVLWCPFNEGWGQFDAAKTAVWLKQYDPSRLIDHASGWFDQGGGDVRSVHIYFRALKMPKKCFGRAPVLSEFGGYNLRIKEHSEQWHKETGYKKCITLSQLQTDYLKLMQQLKQLAKQGLGASVYTQLSDVEGEVNGILTYDRAVTKLNAEQIHSIHRDIIKQYQISYQ